LDKRFKNGLGVMLDDLLAAIYAMLSVQVLMQISHVSA
jgi:phosphatidylglycerophosphatase A